MALKEENVFVTSGKKKASVRKETNAVSGMRVTIVHKNQNPKPPHFPSPRCHEKKYPRQNEPWCHSSTTVQILFEGYLHAIAL